MKKFERRSPTTIALPELTDSEVAELRSALTYKDPEVEQELRRLLPKRAAVRFIERHGLDVFKEKVEDLKARLNISLLRQPPEADEYHTHSGFADRLIRMGYQGDDLPPPDDDITTRPYHLSYKPDVPRYYQLEAVEALWEARHAAVSLPTGSGKSLVAEHLIKKSNCRSVIMAPSRSIAGQLFKQFTKSFGKGSVGLFGDGKKESKKDVVVGIAASLTKVEDGEHYKNLSRAGLFLADESHLTPASTFGRVCLDLMAKTENRFFVSATQFRNDGTGLLLEGITGPVVYSKTLSALVDEGFLARPRFFYMETRSPTTVVSHDWHTMVERHIYGNPVLAREAAELANRCRDVFKSPVLILIDEVSQFKYLLPHLRHEVGFAHGPLTNDNSGEVDERFRKSDVDELVDRFNEGKLPILVGTSCITTGTDLRPTGTIIYLMAGASEVKFMQAVGRGTRLVPGKTTFNFIVFRVLIDGLDGLDNLFERHFREVSSYCRQNFGIKELGFRG